MISVKTLFRDTLHLFYPHVCIGCGTDVLPETNLLCLHCISELPHTNHARHINNPVEKVFWGRMPIVAAHSEFYYAKDSLVQNLIHELKYKSNQAVGVYLGELVGNSLMNSNRFKNIDYLVPMPLFPEKERKRGYNQAAVICEGMTTTMNIPVLLNKVLRKRFTETQTKKHRTERWENVAGSFLVSDPAILANKHVLLVDDVVTTGASLEACGLALLQVPGVRISIATLSMATK